MANIKQRLRRAVEFVIIVKLIISYYYSFNHLQKFLQFVRLRPLPESRHLFSILGGIKIIREKLHPNSVSISFSNIDVCDPYFNV